MGSQLSPEQVAATEEAYRRAGSIRAAGRLLGLSPSGMRHRLNDLHIEIVRPTLGMPCELICAVCGRGTADGACGRDCRLVAALIDAYPASYQHVTSRMPDRAAIMVEILTDRGYRRCASWQGLIPRGYVAYRVGALYHVAWRHP